MAFVWAYSRAANNRPELVRLVGMFLVREPRAPPLSVADEIGLQDRGPAMVHLESARMRRTTALNNACG